MLKSHWLRICICLKVLSVPVWAAQALVSWEVLLPDGVEYINDSPATVETVTLNNTYNPSWFSWSGFALSAATNTTEATYQNQYAAASVPERPYAVGYDSTPWDPAPTISFAVPATPLSIRINNTVYTANAIRNGNSPAHAFADGDYYILTFTAYDASGAEISAIEHTLADFRDGASFIQTQWSTLDLTAFGDGVSSITATLTTTDVGLYGANTPLYFAMTDLMFAYSEGAGGIPADDPAILYWVTGVDEYIPGPGVSNQFANTTNALGPAWSGNGEDGSLDVVSLGDNGSITLTFPMPVRDGPGPDFAVFENAFADYFLELAYVDVSSDGETFFRFPSHTLETNSVGPWGDTDPTAYGGLAGTHIQGFGTPFDLALLRHHAADGLDIENVTHIRLVDILGDGSNLDTYGNPIYDPTPTEGSAGFDLNGIGVLNGNIRLTLDDTADAILLPLLPGFQLQHSPTLLLAPSQKWEPVADRSQPGFYRYARPETKVDGGG